ncbi:ImmA/IrrE family metallo-endopeptidase [Alicyclobacillus fastidiosus]|uniref:ImmA/IrrE family metallo-endopeptidase n=1 Tax=Alicyclobacillus fastidiosus TaxID=392011 RepID=A0ABV5A9T0_9BACL|nr:ImmA/IrrE family metallo-endopeptidase [Alicyclobacillus fastidiosus]WEH10946.1 ImmA/IrrE family metallo-endopeptidase [Alicyclobacillus fastidiosus]
MLETSTAVTDVQKFTRALYQDLGIYTPGQIDFEYIASAIGIEIRFCPVGSKAFMKTRIAQVDSRLSAVEQRNELAHEIAHIILHSGSQLHLPKLFIELQERQANILAAELLAPMYMVKQLFESESMPNDERLAAIALSEVFHLTPPMGKARIAKYKQLLWYEHTPQFGRDFDNSIWIGYTRLMFKNGQVVGRRRHVD